MTITDFRNLALSLPEASEQAHMGHPDFRVRGKVFATLGHPGGEWGVVILTPQQQEAFVAAEPAVYSPVAGGWGARGATTIRLAAAVEESARRALVAAWRNKAPKRVGREFDDAE